MISLNIFLNPDGSIAWLNLVLLLILFGAGFLVNRLLSGKKTEVLNSSISEWQNKSRKAEQEFKSYKSGQEALQRQHEKSLSDMTARVKSLEGDIRALAEEKNKMVQQLQEKEGLIKESGKQLSARDDTMKATLEEHNQAVHDLSAKLQLTREELNRAKSWEKNARLAEEEAQKARNAFNDLQRKTLESELRLKTASDYAARVQPLEQALLALEQKYKMLESEVQSQQDSGHMAMKQAADLSSANDHLISEISRLSAQLAEKQKTISDLMLQLSEAGKEQSLLAVLENELGQLKQAHKALQQELAQKKEQPITGFSVSPPPPGEETSLTGPVVSDTEPGQGEES